MAKMLPRLCFPLRPALPGFVHLPLQRRDVGEGVGYVGGVQAVARHQGVGNPKAPRGRCGWSFCHEFHKFRETKFVANPESSINLPFVTSCRKGHKVSHSNQVTIQLGVGLY